MISRHVLFVALAAAIGVASGLPLTPANAQSTAATQTNDGGGVTVQVTWNGPSNGPVFRVAMNTHSVDLDQYDLSTLAVLRTDQGTDVRPSAWDAPKGGHHREGTLTFPAQGKDGKSVLGQNTRAITLIIRGIAGVPERAFRWTW